MMQACWGLKRKVRQPVCQPGIKDSRFERLACRKMELDRNVENEKSSHVIRAREDIAWSREKDPGYQGRWGPAEIL